MAAVSLRSLTPGTRVNLVIATTVDNRTRFNNFTYMGDVSFAVAAAAAQLDIRTLVDATKAYFRTGSAKEAERITYVLLKQNENSPLVVIPEPLINLNTVEVAGDELHTVVVRDSITKQRLQEILAGNGLQDFTIVTSQV